ncbi:hypothetical protein CDAR_233401 [Caerostris darwini]|uniref:Uncharacterized protein n=1 Tax=Caerostris darwini TaxID=1538125 RepID=A0AAV4PKS0_9ARAC|nr:hypothetical protein CDAR_233401 [Caerostris darwini]
MEPINFQHHIFLQNSSADDHPKPNSSACSALHLQLISQRTLQPHTKQASFPKKASLTDSQLPPFPPNKWLHQVDAIQPFQNSSSLHQLKYLFSSPLTFQEGLSIRLRTPDDFYDPRGS